MSEEKKQLRKLIFSRRKEATDQEIEEWSRMLFGQIREMDLYKNAKHVFAYMDYNHEVMTREFIRGCWEDGKKTAVPRVNGRVMNFYEITDFRQTAPGCMGICEPADNDAIGYRMVDHLADNWEDALLIVPGVAFDVSRNRCGYGGGYYDKYQEIHREHPTIAVCFEFQIVDRVPVNEYDIKPQMLVTEKRVIR